VLSGRGLCNELITSPEKSYRLSCVLVCDLETSRMRRPWPALGRSTTVKKRRGWGFVKDNQFSQCIWVLMASVWTCNHHYVLHPGGLVNKPQSCHPYYTIYHLLYLPQ
jgi:hypothetical protein